MKTKELIVAFAAMFALTIAIPAESAAAPPYWAPANGYRAKNTHIYFPQQNFYYDLHRGVYIYMNGRNWSTSAALPVMYRNINLSVVPQVQLVINNHRPYDYNSNHRAKYWNRKAQHDYYKRMEKHQRTYSKAMYKADKKYYRANKKMVKKYYKQNKNHR